MSKFSATDPLYINLIQTYTVLYRSFILKEMSASTSSTPSPITLTILPRQPPVIPQFNHTPITPIITPTPQNNITRIMPTLITNPVNHITPLITPTPQNKVTLIMPTLTPASQNTHSVNHTNLAINNVIPPPPVYTSGMYQRQSTLTEQEKIERQKILNREKQKRYRSKTEGFLALAQSPSINERIKRLWTISYPNSLDHVDPEVIDAMIAQFVSSMYMATSNISHGTNELRN